MKRFPIVLISFVLIAVVVSVLAVSRIASAAKPAKDIPAQVASQVQKFSKAEWISIGVYSSMANELEVPLSRLGVQGSPSSIFDFGRSNMYITADGKFVEELVPLFNSGSASLLATDSITPDDVKPAKVIGAVYDRAASSTAMILLYLPDT